VSLDYVLEDGSKSVKPSSIVRVGTRDEDKIGSTLDGIA